MTDLPWAVTLSYNGISFPVYTSTKVSGTPVYDEAGRTVVAVTYTLTAEAYFTVDGLPGAEVGDEMDSIRTGLTKPGGQLLYSGNGFGPFAINTQRADCRWGPKPKLISWRPVGTERTCHVVWQVEVCIAECESGGTGIPVGSPRPPMEYNYGVSYAVDAAGYQNITYSGHVVVATTRRNVNDRNLSDHADRLREQLMPPTPRRFRVGSRSFTLSKDKCRLDFSVTFEQLPPSVPPPGVVSVRAEHSMSSNPVAAVVWEGSISATYEMAYGVPRADCLAHFLDLIKDRLDHAGRQRAGAGDAGPWAAALNAAANLRGLVVPTRMSISESLYGREAASLSLSYAVTIGAGGLRQAVDVLGFFRPPPGAGNWQGWHDSLSGSGRPFHPRGVAGSRFDPQQDRLVDLCMNVGGGRPIPAGNPGAGVLAPPGLPPVNGPRVFQLINGLGTQPRPEQTWLDFRSILRVETEDPNVQQSLLPARAVALTERAQLRTVAPGGGAAVPYRNAPESVIQQRGAPRIVVILEGKALRVGYSIPEPEINKVGGMDAVPSNRLGVEYFRQGVVGNLMLPVCGASWRLRWILTGVPAGFVPPLDNPIYGKVISQSASEIKGVF